MTLLRCILTVTAFLCVVFITFRGSQAEEMDPLSLLGTTSDEMQSVHGAIASQLLSTGEETLRAAVGLAAMSYNRELKLQGAKLLLDNCHGCGDEARLKSDYERQKNEDDQIHSWINDAAFKAGMGSNEGVAGLLNMLTDPTGQREEEALSRLAQSRLKADYCYILSEKDEDVRKACSLAITEEVLRSSKLDLSQSMRERIAAVCHIGINIIAADPPDPDVLRTTCNPAQGTPDVGDTRAMVDLGQAALDRGPEGAQEALRWFKTAADLHNGDAMGLAGAMIARSAKVFKDKEDAVALVKGGVDRNSKIAKYEFAILQFEGIAIDQQRSEALGTFENLTRFHNCSEFADGCLYVASLYERGDGVVQDLDKAADIKLSAWSELNSNSQSAVRKARALSFGLRVADELIKTGFPTIASNIYCNLTYQHHNGVPDSGSPEASIACAKLEIGGVSDTAGSVHKTVPPNPNGFSGKHGLLQVIKQWKGDPKYVEQAKAVWVQAGGKPNFKY